MKVSSTHDGLEQENRKARVLSLHSRGLTQEEIARQVGVSQMTVSRDLHQIRQESRKKIEEDTANAYFEYRRFLTGNDQVIKTLWEIAEGSIRLKNNNININNNIPDPHVNSHNKDRISALALIEQCQKDRLEASVGGPASGMNALRYARSIINGEAESKRYEQRMKNDDFFRAVEKGIIS